MRTLISSLTCLGFIVLAGCPGNAPPNTGDDTPPEVDAAVEVDAPPPDPGQRLSGTTYDYFNPTAAMDQVTLTSDGVNPPMMTLSAIGGLYSIDAVPTGSVFYLTATRPLYRPTRNPAITVAGVAVMKDIHLMTLQEVANQYATTGNALAPGKAFVAVQLRRNNGMPLDGITLDKITLVDALNVVVPGTKIYVFGARDLDPAAGTPTSVTTTIAGRSRIGILDVPPGAYTLKVLYLDGQGVEQTQTTPILTAANSATIVLTGNELGGGGTMQPPPPLNPTFATDIYPRLQKAATGGLGCANCHTAGGSAGGIIQYDLGATITLDNMKARPGLIDLIAPANSLLLTKPLYEPPPANHPNATFLDINDQNYKTFLRWITQGALP